MLTRHRTIKASRSCFAPVAAAAALLLFVRTDICEAQYAVQASATILSKNNCSFTTTTGTLNFPAIDPSSSSNVSGSVLLTFSCNGSGNPVVYSITSDDGLHKLGTGQPQMANTGATAFLAYALNTPISGSTPKNTSTNVTITGTITPAQFQNALATSYADTVVLTVSP